MLLEKITSLGSNSSSLMPQMKLVYPMDLKNRPESPASSEIDRRYTAAISSIGYGEAEQAKLSRKFDVDAKITTIVSLQTPEEKKACLVDAIEVLKKRHSLMNLLFLKKLIEGRRINEGKSSTSGRTQETPSSRQVCDLSIGREKLLFQIFKESDSLSLVEFSLQSKNKEFLENLVSLLIFILRVHKVEFPFLREILRSYAIINQKLILSYISICKEVDPLYLRIPIKDSANSISSTTGISYLQLLILNVLKVPVIANELDFLVEKRCRLDGILTLAQLEASKKQFADKHTYERLHAYVFSTGIKDNAARSKDTTCSKRSEATTMQTNMKEGPSDPSSISTRTIRREEIKKIIEYSKKYKLLVKSLDLDLKKMKEKVSELEVKNESLQEKLKASETIIKEKELAILNAVKLVREEPKSPEKQSTKLPISPLKDESAPAENLVARDKTVALKPSAPKDSPLKPAAKPRSGRFGVKKAPAIKSKFSEKKYTGLSWTKCSKQNTKIFTKVDPQDLENLFTLEEFALFEEKKQVEVQKPVQVVHNVGHMEQKKAHALNIALSRVKISNEELIGQIMNGTIDNESLVSQLVAYFPTNSELDAISSAPSQQNRAEQLFKAVPDPVSFQHALMTRKFLYAFRVRDYLAEISRLSSVYTAFLESREVVKLFGCLLAIGNILNANRFSGRAEGFSIDSLIEFEKPEILRIVSKKISVENLTRELGVLSNGLGKENVSIEVLTQEINDIKRLFVDGAISSDVTHEYENILSSFNMLQEKHHQLVAYFGDKASVVCNKLYEFLKALNDVY